MCVYICFSVHESVWKPSTEAQRNHLRGMFITSKHVCEKESMSSAPGYLETCLTSPGRQLPGLPAQMAPAMQSLPDCPTNSLSRHPRRPDGQLTIWSSLPNPRHHSRVLKVLFAQTQMEPQPRRLVLCPGTSVSLPTYLQVPTPRSKKTQTLYTHLLKLLLHRLLMRHPCFHDRLKGKRVWALFFV